MCLCVCVGSQVFGDPGVNRTGTLRDHSWTQSASDHQRTTPDHFSPLPRTVVRADRWGPHGESRSAGHGLLPLVRRMIDTAVAMVRAGDAWAGAAYERGALLLAARAPNWYRYRYVGCRSAIFNERRPARHGQWRTPWIVSPEARSMADTCVRQVFVIDDGVKCSRDTQQ
jgi:hypothetical protein